MRTIETSHLVTGCLRWSNWGRRGWL